MRTDVDRVFLFEYATCTDESLPPGTAVEGLGMFKTLYFGFENPVSFYNKTDYLDVFKEHLETAEYTLAVAPETGMELHRLTKLVEKSGSRNLGCRSEAVHITSDKLLTYAKLKDLSPKTELFNRHAKLDFPLVAKPCDGVSCEGVMLIKSEEELENVPSDYLLQEYVSGRPMSASLLIGDDVRVLSINSQEMDGFNYTGAKLPLQIADVESIVEAVQRVPGLFGYVGVDFILTDERLCILEINPRPTTPIIGLNHAFDINISELILNNGRGKNVPEISPKRMVYVKKTRSRSGYVSCDGFSIEIKETL
ncbi:MAG TPA: ATP-grasp domain-containing protein [Euryarchaeota archaeon]|nr:ATP-grasp domain-containing protein [Euryarchaeota archaeon]